MIRHALREGHTAVTFRTGSLFPAFSLMRRGPGDESRWLSRGAEEKSECEPASPKGRLEGIEDPQVQDLSGTEYTGIDGLAEPIERPMQVARSK